MKKILVVISLFVLLSQAVLSYGVLIHMNSEDLLELGNIFHRNAEYDLAENAYSQSLSIKDAAITHHNRGINYYEQGNLILAESEFTAAIVIDQNYAKAYNSLGILLFEAQRYNEAAINFESASKLNPSAQVYFDHGVSLSNSFRFENAPVGVLDDSLRSFRLAIELDPSFPHAQSNAKVIEDILEKI